MRPNARAIEPKPPRDVLGVCEPLLDHEPPWLRLELDDDELPHPVRWSGGTSGPQRRSRDVA